MSYMRRLMFSHSAALCVSERRLSSQYNTIQSECHRAVPGGRLFSRQPSLMGEVVGTVRQRQ